MHSPCSSFDEEAEEHPAQIIGREQEFKDEQAPVIDFVSSLELSSPDVLRAAPAGALLQGFGRVLRAKNPDPDALYKMSHVVPVIQEFWSHSWQASAFWKVWLLLMMGNGAPALLVGTFFAMLAGWLTVVDVLPGTVYKAWIRGYQTQGFEFEHKFAPWGMLSGPLFAVLALLIFRPKSLVFLDRACIHQENTRLKAAGVLNLGAILKRSKSLLVLWDPTYLTRLWCVFELSAFLNSHKADRLPALNVKPLGLAKVTLCAFLGGLLLPLGDLLLPTNVTSSLSPAGLRGAYFLTYCVCANLVMTRYWREIAQADGAFSEFSWDGLKCHCCEQNHVVNGNPVPCDREILAQCVCRWFGSIEAFEVCVRTEVREAFLAQLVKGMPFGYRWLLAIHVFWVWSQCDYTASRVHAGDYRGTLRSVAAAGVWWLWVGPVGFQVFVAIARWQIRTRSWLRQLAGIIMFWLLVGSPQFFQFYLFAYMENKALASVVFAGVTLLGAISVYCLLSRPLGPTSRHPTAKV